jgi:hypothetical protein
MKNADFAAFSLCNGARTMSRLHETDEAGTQALVEQLF